MKDILEPATYETANCADGPKVVAWLEERGLYASGQRARLIGNIDRQLRRWKIGENPAIPTLDRVLLNTFDTFLNELPDDVWLFRRRPTKEEARTANRNAPTSADSYALMDA